MLVGSFHKTIILLRNNSCTQLNSNMIRNKEDDVQWNYSEAFRRGDIKREAWGKLSQASVFAHLSANREAVEKNINLLAQPKFDTKRLRSKEQYKSTLHRDHEGIKNHKCNAWPDKGLIVCWRMSVSVLAVSILLVTPVTVSFVSYPALSTALYHLISDAMLIADSIISLIVNKSSLAKRPVHVFKRYRLCFFLVDFITSLPIDYILVISGGGEVMLVCRFLRLVRVVVLVRLWRYSSHLLTVVCTAMPSRQASTNALHSLNGISKLAILILVFAHWAACVQYLVVLACDFSPSSWVALYGMNASTSWFLLYSHGLLRTLSNIVCLGYGLQAPDSLDDILATLCTMVVGALCYAFLIGYSTTLFISKHTCDNRAALRRRQLLDYMANCDLPDGLKCRITNYYERRYQGKMFDEARILAGLNHCLREEIMTHNCYRALLKSPFFRFRPEISFLNDVVRKFHFQIYLAGDFLVRPGSRCSRLFVLGDGVVDVIATSGCYVDRLQSGSYFGEVALMTQHKQLLAYRAETPCSVFYLEEGDVDELVSNYEDAYVHLKQLADRRLAELRQATS